MLVSNGVAPAGPISRIPEESSLRLVEERTAGGHRGGQLVI